MIELSIKTPTQFALEIESIVKDKQIDYLEAVMYYVEKYNVEIETIASFILNLFRISFIIYNMLVIVHQIFHSVPYFPVNIQY